MLAVPQTANSGTNGACVKNHHTLFACCAEIYIVLQSPTKEKSLYGDAPCSIDAPLHTLG